MKLALGISITLKIDKTYGLYSWMCVCVCVCLSASVYLENTSSETSLDFSFNA